jgi:hypothetical protein
LAATRAGTGTPPARNAAHTADQNADGLIGLSELLRVIQFFNAGGFHCAADPGSTEDGYAAGTGANHACAPHASDYLPSGPDWLISLSELLRLIQFFNSGGYHVCPGEETEDGYCPGEPAPDSTPPGAVSDFEAVAGDAQVALTWTNPMDTDFDHVAITRKEDAAPTSASDGVSVYDGAGTAATDTAVINGTEYFYAAWAYDTSGNRSEVATTAGVIPTSSSASPDILEDLGALIEDIRAIPPDGIPPDGLGAMGDALEDAEFQYRVGDPCGAGLSLLDYLGLAQSVRSGAAAPLAELLYNRGRMLRFVMLAGNPLADGCPGAERIGAEAEAEAREESEEGFLAGVQFGEPKVRTVRANGETFTELFLPGADPRTGQPGAPGVPMISRLFAVPIGAEASFDVTCALAETVHLNLMPVQAEPVDQGDDPFAGQPFVKNEQLYSTDALYPPQVAAVQYLGDMRELRIFMATVAAGQYNPVSDELLLFKDLELGVTFSGGEGGFLRENTAHAFDNGTLFGLGTILNRGSCMRKILPPDAWRQFGEELMIITTPALRPAADTLAAWKNEKGLVTRVYEAMDVDGPGPDSAQGIDIMIHNRYAAACVRPSYVLLLGDAELIPTFYPDAEALTPYGAPGAGTLTIGSDWQYAVYGDPDTDMIPDFAVGRIPVDTLEQANIVVNKIIAYEQTPPESPAFYANAAIAAQFQCCRYDIDEDGYDMRTFIESSEFARNALAGAGKSVQRIYTRTWSGYYSGDSTPRRYYDGALLPAAIGPGYDWAGTTADIVDAFNAGRFLFIHRDHGEPTGWCHPRFYLYDADDLVNGNLLPVVYSVNCASGLWDNETAPGAIGTSTTGVYLAEALLRDPDGGAIGILGDTRNSPSWANSALLRGFLDATWPSAIGTFGGSTPKRRLGDILNHGKLYLWTQIGAFEIDNAKARDELRMWHVIGDPTLEMWSRSPFLILLPDTIRAEMLALSALVQYSQDGATITAVEIRPEEGRAPIARGTVRDGEANMPYVNAPYGKFPIEYYVSYENAVCKRVEPEDE